MFNLKIVNCFIVRTHLHPVRTYTWTVATDMEAEDVRSYNIQIRYLLTDS